MERSESGPGKSIKAGDGIRTHDVQLGNLGECLKKARKTSVFPNEQPGFVPDPDFAIVAEYWANLPTAIKAGILAMVRTAVRTGNQSQSSRDYQRLEPANRSST